MSPIVVILLNTYREAVRARILHGLLALAVATACYALVVGHYASKSTLRVISDIGSFGVSFYGVLVAIVLGASSLYRELELKTVYPILARPLSRAQYLVGKVLGIWLTLAVFMCANSAVLLLALSFAAGGSALRALATPLGLALLAIVVGRKLKGWGTYLPIAWAAALLCCAWWFAKEAPDDRQVVLASALLALLEVGIVIAIATLFSAFSSPFLTAIFTFSVFIVGRSADTLAKLPVRVFGEGIAQAGAVLAKVFPNLMLYVPQRTLLTGELAEVHLHAYVLTSALHSVLWVTGLLVLSAAIFRNRDFV